ILAALGFFIWQKLSARESTDDAQIDAHISPISPRVGGTVIAVYVDDNQLVQEGTVLLQLDPADYKVAVSQAQAELANAEAAARAATQTVPVPRLSSTGRLSGAEAGLRAAEAAVIVAEKNAAAAEAAYKSALARVQEAEANYIKAAKDVERYKLL